MKSPPRGCGTCKVRHISCDRGLPTCLNCIRSNRPCKGYEFVLSWPKPNDRRRAMLGKAPSAKANAKSKANGACPTWIVNTFVRDIEIHHYLTSPDFSTLPPLPTAMSWIPIESDSDYNLLQYFAANASNSLISVCPSEGSPNLRDIIVRLALSSGERSSTPVLQSLLALASLHRHGPQAHAARSKLSALAGLAASARNGVVGHEVIAHVASLMLLCCFEIQYGSESTQWLYYITAVKNVLRAARRSSSCSFDGDPDMVSLLYWASYHDVLAQFSLCYWKPKHPWPVREAMAKDILVQENLSLEASNLPSFCPGMLRILSEVFNVIFEPLDGRIRAVKNKNLLTVLEWKIRKIPLCANPKDTTGRLPMDDSMSTTLFQLALLVYLERASGHSPLQSAKMRSRIDKAMVIFSGVKYLPRKFPLLILGCEARSDEDRMVVLDLISRTENAGLRTIQSMKVIMQSLWAQDDLAEREISYTDKMRAVLSDSGILPSFT